MSYAEDHCALRWPLLAAGIYFPAFAIALFVASLVAHVPALNWIAFAIVLLATCVWVTCNGTWLLYLWPTGIRLDSQGVRIGGVSWAQRHPGRLRTRKAIVPRQCSQVFGSPWSGVLSIGVTSDPDAIKIMKRRAYRGRKITPLGNLAVPFMRAALVIWVDESQAQVPEIRPATAWAWYSCPEPGFHQPLWVVPTRRPAQLQAVLAMDPLSAARLQDPREVLRFDPPIAEWASP